MFDEWELPQEVQYGLQVLFGNGLQALLVVGFHHHGEMAVTSARDGCGARLVVVQSELTEAHTLLKDGDLDKKMILKLVFEVCDLLDD